MRLVLAGSHQQFADWLRLVYGPGGGQGEPPARPVFREEDLWGLHVHHVDLFHQVGEYWLNPVWGSQSYRLFMEEGVLEGMCWAMDWELDFRKAQAQRTPISAADIRATRDSLLQLQRELGDV